VASPSRVDHSFFVGCLLAEDETTMLPWNWGNSHPVMQYIIPEEWMTNFHCCKSLKTWEKWCFYCASSVCTILAVMIMIIIIMMKVLTMYYLSVL